MRVSSRAVLVRVVAMFKRRSCMLLRFFVLAHLVVMLGLVMMMRGGMVVRGGEVMMFARRMLRLLRHVYVPPWGRTDSTDNSMRRNKTGCESKTSHPAAG